MTGRYSSFLIRYWHLAGGARRVIIEHVQSGEQATVPTLAAAADWINSWADDAREPADDRTDESDATVP
jgi:hypothetical protein